MKKPIFTVMSTLVTLLLSVAVTLAQGACGEFVDQALSAVDTSCSDLGRNQACYGFNRVEASFAAEVAENFFTQPSDVTNVLDLETLRTAPLNLQTNEWGVAVMVLQANMPETLPGQNVTFILMGDTEIENAVAPDDAYDPIAGIDVTVTFPQGAAVRSGPGDNFNVLGGVTVGSIFTVDGMSEDQAWLRTVWQERPAWIRRTTVDPIPAIDALPILDETLRTPMQAFYLRTGIGEPTCNEVPDDSLLIQGPDDIEIDLTVNGANIQLGSSGILRVIQGADAQPLLEIVVLDGEFVVKADENNPQDVVIRAGQRSTLCLADGNNLGVNGEADDLLVTCGASAPEPLDVTAFQSEFCNLEQVPSSLLNYDLQTCNTRTHAIQSGENLFRIAQFYCVELADLIAINGITDPTALVVGQEILLPLGACNGTGSTRPPVGAANPPLTDDTSDDAVACSQLISPLTNVNSGNHTFSWTPYAGTNVSYQLVFFNFEGLQMETFSTTDTSYSLNLGQQTSTGGEFNWAVYVLENNSFVCSSGQSPRLIRTGELNPSPVQQPVGGGSSASINTLCRYNGSGFDIGISWSNLPAGQTIQLELLVTDPQGNQIIAATLGPFRTANGSESTSIDSSFTTGSAKASTSGGEMVNLTCA